MPQYAWAYPIIIATLAFCFACFVTFDSGSTKFTLKAASITAFFVLVVGYCIWGLVFIQTHP